MTTPERRQAWRRGRWGETWAVWWLRLKGYAVLTRGYRIGRGTGAGEVDIIARRGGVLVFVEVKTRLQPDQAAQAITPTQQRRIARAAQAFLAAHPHLHHCAIRFDAVLISPGHWPRHISDAWRMDA